MFAFDGGMTPDQTLFGSIAFSADPDVGGIEVGDIITLNLSLSSQGGPLTGTIAARVIPTNSTTSEIDGTIDVVDRSTLCTTNFTIDPAAPLTIEGFGGGVEPQLAINILGTNVYGLIDFVMNLLGTQLSGTIDLPEGAQEATVTGTDGTADVDFDVPIFPDDQAIDELLSCALQAEVIIFILPALYDAVIEAGGEEDIEDVEITPGLPGVFDFVVTREGATIAGTLTLTGLTTADVTWTFDAPGFTGGSTTTWRVDLPLLGDPCVSGDASFLREGELDCTLDIEIPVTDPLKIAFDEDNEIVGGSLTFRATIGDDWLEIMINSDELEEGTAKVNGIPIPIDALIGDD